jgi:hypothetical protein
MDHSLHVGSCVSVHLFTTPKLEIPIELSNPFARCVGAVVRGLTLLVPYQSPHPAGITHIRGIRGTYPALPYLKKAKPHETVQARLVPDQY